MANILRSFEGSPLQVVVSDARMFGELARTLERFWTQNELAAGERA